MMRGELKRYEQYKDSGVNCLGKVPAGWEVKRLKEFANIVRGGSPRPAGDLRYYEGNIPFLKVGDLTKTESIYLEKHTHTIKEEGLSSTRLVGAGTLMLTNSGATLGIPKICTFATTFNDGIAAFLGLKKHNQKFLFYLLKTKTQWYLNQAALGQGQPNLNTDIIGNTFFSCPSKQEQQAITAYLDEKTARIDRKIELLSQKADLYRELKQALINKTVTRGLDPTVPMKDSGVEWIGEVPAHWEVERIGTAFEERREIVNDTDYPPLSVTMKGIVPQLDTAAKTMHNDNRKKVVEGDFVINSRSDRRGSSGIALINGSVSVINIVLEPMRNFYGMYLHHLFRSYNFIEEFYRVGRGIVDDLWTTRYAVMRSIDFAYPAYKEQQAIATYLDTKTAQIEQIITTITTQIQTLQELRKTLINDVVTGKIKVV